MYMCRFNHCKDRQIWNKHEDTTNFLKFFLRVYNKCPFHVAFPTLNLV